LKTLGAKARAKGLAPLAELIRKGVPPKTESRSDTIKNIVAPFINEEKEVNNQTEAIAGAVDIIAEELGSDPDIRQIVREIVFQRTILQSTKHSQLDTKTFTALNKDGKPVDPQTFEIYFNFRNEAARIQNHQILALHRADQLGILSLQYDTPDEELLERVKKHVLIGQSIRTNVFFSSYKKSVEAAYRRYIIRSIKREYWKTLLNKAEAHAIHVFADNLKNLLMTPPLSHRAIIGIDPGFKSGCKVAVIDEYGNYLEKAVIYPHPPQQRMRESEQILLKLVEDYNVHTFAIGNGTASRETEKHVSDIIRKYAQSSKSNVPLEYAIVSEAGASIYSASPLAIEEFPDLDLTVRGAISIARRLQDPLSELIKIDPKSIGVGMYQHDVNQTALKSELDAVIEDCVNNVGVDLNTASSKLLEYVSGLTKQVSKRIVATRKDKGPFTSRKQLKDIKGLGAKTFEQCAGFLKIREATNPLDTTFVHPESYKLSKQILETVKCTPNDIIDSVKREKVQQALSTIRPEVVAQQFNVPPTRVKYLIEQLSKPDLDPRENLDAPVLRQDVLSMKDLKEGMILQGTIRNVVDFGAFVDIGVKVNGLVHKSQIANQYLKNPRNFLKVGEVKKFRILSLDITRKRINLSLKNVIEE
jgi:uncharacterized protein